MLYRDYSRRDGEWMPNVHGGRENLEAIDFLRTLNAVIEAEQPGCIMIAEESTAWPGVTAPVSEDGLGFTFKWNMGWMHDTLLFFALDPVHRRFHLNDLTFAMLYEYTERFLMPLSHDEVVHGKGSLLRKMPGDEWQRFANLRLLLAYQWTRPGKKLLFMGTELASWNEWHHETSLDWHLADDPLRAGFARFLEDLGRLYRESPSLWRWDHDPAGFSWIDCSDADNTVLLIIEGQKMSKSLGNFYTLRDLFARGHKPSTIRFLLLSVPYRRQLNFTEDGLTQARNSVERLRNFVARLKTSQFPAGSNAEMLKRIDKAESDFDAGLADDINTAMALAAVFDLVRDINTAMDRGEFLQQDAVRALAATEKFDAILAVLSDTDDDKLANLGFSPQKPRMSAEEVDALIEERNAAKKRRDFKRSDEIRQKLADSGIMLEDTKDGSVRWKYK